MDSSHDQTADFEFPPAKRQRTASPPPTIPTAQPVHLPATTAVTTLSEDLSHENVSEEKDLSTTTMPIPGLGFSHDTDPKVQQHQTSGENFHESNAILDVLMQHVESNESPPHVQGHGETTISKPELGNIEVTSEATGDVVTAVSAEIHRPPQEEENHNATKKGEVRDQVENIYQDDASSHTDLPKAVADNIGGELSEHNVHSLPGNEAPLIADAPNDAEWEVDSSPVESSSVSDTSTDTSASDDSDDDDADAEYSVLGLEEQARILMQGDGGSDDEGGPKANSFTQLRTTNERPEEVIPKPDIEVTSDMTIQELGVVQSVVESENVVLIKANISGDYRVLESGSLLCLEDRKVVGLVHETLGRVEQPLYTVRFTNAAAIEEAGLSAVGTTVHYVESHSTFVFTQPLKAIKGSDASNFHDEEVGAEEIEFSDDEAEAEYKRQAKLKRQGRKDDRGGRAAYQNNTRRAPVTHTHDGDNGGAYGTGSIVMNYDEVQDGADDGYTPLRRPMYPPGTAPPTSGHGKSWGGAPQTGDSRGVGGRQNHQHRGGPRSRGSYGQRGGRGREQDRASLMPQGQQQQPYQQRQPYPQPQQQQLQQPPYHPQTPAFSPSHLPNQPIIFPQNSGFTPFSPSPISPLPNTQYNFNSQPNQNTQPPFTNSYPPRPSNTQTHQQMPPPGSHVNPAFMAALHQHQGMLQQHQQQQHYSGQGSYNQSGIGNPAVSEAQARARQEEILRNLSKGP